MNRNLHELRKENNLLDEALCKDYQLLMTDIVCYLRGANISELQQESVRYDLTVMLLDAQQKQLPLTEVFPKDYKAFCDTIIAELPPRSRREKLQERLNIACLLLAVLGVINLFISRDGIQALLKFNIKATYSLSLSTLLLDFLLAICAIGIVLWVCRSSFENNERTVQKYAILLWLFVLAASVVCMMLFQNIILLQFPIWLLITTSICCYLLHLFLERAPHTGAQR